MIHILDGKTDILLNDITKDKVISNNHTKAMENFRETFDFETFLDEDYAKDLTKRNRVIIPDEDGNLIEFIIFEVGKFRNQGRKTIEVYTTASYLDLNKSRIISPHRTASQSVEQHATSALAGTEWEIGEIVDKGNWSITFDDYDSPFNYLKKIAFEFDLELNFRVEHNGNQITGRYVDFVERIGTYRGREVTFGKDLIEISRVEKFDNIVTALRGIGPEDSDGNRLEVYEEDTEALERWGRNGQHLVEVYYPQGSNLTLDRLSLLTRNELNRRINSVVEYQANAVDLENIIGMENQQLRFGDTIRIKDTQFSPPLYVEARVHTQKRDIFNSGNKEVTLGDFTEYTEDEIFALWRSLQSQISDRFKGVDSKRITGDYRATISSYKEPVEAQKSAIDAQYEELRRNPDLSETLKSQMHNAKIDYNVAYENLMNAIRATEEKPSLEAADLAEVQREFNNYRLALEALVAIMEQATDSIAGYKADEAERRSNEYINQIRQEIQAAMAAAQERIDEANAEIERANQELERAERELRESNERIEQAQGQLDEDMGGLRTDLDEAAGNIDTAKEDISHLRTALDDKADTTYVNTQLNLKADSELVNKLSDTASDLLETVGDIDRLVQEHGSNFTRIDQEIDDIEGSYALIAESVETLDETVTRQQTAIETNAGEISTRVSRTELEGEIEDTKLYIQSRGENLVINGTGLMGDNTNFSRFTFDGSQTFAGRGSFHTGLQNATLSNDEFIPVDPSRTYRFSLMAKSEKGIGHEYYGVISYDIDLNIVTPYTFYGSKFTPVELTQDLKIGDMVIHLSDVSQFRDDQATPNHYHSLVLWGYQNSYGYEYPAGTYSRYVFYIGWDQGAIDRENNTITLNKPFNVENQQDPEGTFRAGHKVSPTHSGGNFQYMTASNVNTPTEWTYYEGEISGNGIGNNEFPHGTAYVKLLFLVNRSVSGGQPGDSLWVNSLNFTDITTEKNAKGYTDDTLEPIELRISNTESEIIQHADLIASKVEQETFDTVTGEISNQLSEIEQTATGITATVSDLQADIDGLEIGGRNLLIGSSHYAGWEFRNSNGTYNFTPEQLNAIYEGNQVEFDVITNGLALTSDFTPVTYGEQYTAQGKVEQIEGIRDSFILNVLAYDDEKNLLDEEVLTLDKGTENVNKVSYTSSYKGLLVFSNNSPTNHLYATFTVSDERVAYIRVRVGAYSSASVSRIRVKDVKLEQGGTMTEWTPAPEDSAVYTQTQIQQLSNEISATYVKDGELIAGIRIGDPNPISGANIEITGDTLIRGDIGAENATFIGLNTENMTAVNANIENATIIGNISAGEARFENARMVQGIFQDITMTGDIIAPAARFLRATMEKATIIDADIQDATITGTLTGVDGTFTGTLTGVDGTFTGTMTAGKIQSDTEVNVTTDITVGNNIYLQSKNYADRFIRKGIYFLERDTGYESFIDSMTNSMTLRHDTSVNISARTLNVYTDFMNVNAQVYFNGGIQVPAYQNIEFGTGGTRSLVYRDTTSAGRQRLKMETQGGNGGAIWIDPNGNIYFVYQNVVRHSFYSGGTKSGGSIDIDGKRWGMSPIDSPRTLITDILFNINIDGESKVFLEERYSKSIESYAVFPNNPNIEIVEKSSDHFIARGEGSVDFIIHGVRRGFSDQYFQDMDILE